MTVLIMAAVAASTATRPAKAAPYRYRREIQAAEPRMPDPGAGRGSDPGVVAPRTADDDGRGNRPGYVHVDERIGGTQRPRDPFAQGVDGRGGGDDQQAAQDDGEEERSHLRLPLGLGFRPIPADRPLDEAPVDEPQGSPTAMRPIAPARASRLRGADPVATGKGPEENGSTA